MPPSTIRTVRSLCWPVIARVTPDVVDNARALLGDLATASKARWGMAQLESTRAALHDEGLPAFGLPEPQAAANDGSVPVRSRLAELRSDATCAALGFPDAARPYDAILKASGRPVGDGWVVALTPEPLTFAATTTFEPCARPASASTRSAVAPGTPATSRSSAWTSRRSTTRRCVSSGTCSSRALTLCGSKSCGRRTSSRMARGRPCRSARPRGWIFRPLWDPPHASPTRDRRLRQAAEEARRLALEDGRGRGRTADAVMSERLSDCCAPRDSAHLQIDGPDVDFLAKTSTHPTWFIERDETPGGPQAARQHRPPPDVDAVTGLPLVGGLHRPPPVHPQTASGPDGPTTGNVCP